MSSTGGFASSKELKKIGRKDFNYTNTDDFIVFQEPFVEDYIKDQSTESINYSSHLGHIGHAGINENFHGGSQADTVAASDYGIATDSENEIDHEIDHENSHENSHNSSHEKDDHGNGYENNHQNGFNNNNIDKLNLKNGHNNINEEIIQNGASDVTSKINKKNGKKINYHIDRDDEESEERDDEEINGEINHKKLAEILKEKLEEKDDEVSGDGDKEEEDYDETDFDEMEDKTSYTSDVNGQPDTPEKQEITENTFYSNWYMPSDSITKVKFATDIISDVFIIREKHSLYEIPTLFYTHDESIQFTADYNRYVRRYLRPFIYSITCVPFIPLFFNAVIVIFLR